MDVGVGENDDFTIEAFFYVPDLNYENTAVDVIARKRDAYTFYIDFDKDTPDWIVFELIAAGGGEITLRVELDIFNAVASCELWYSITNILKTKT